MMRVQFFNNRFLEWCQMFNLIVGQSLVSPVFKNNGIFPKTGKGIAICEGLFLGGGIIVQG